MEQKDWNDDITGQKRKHCQLEQKKNVSNSKRLKTKPLKLKETKTNETYFTIDKNNQVKLIGGYAYESKDLRCLMESFQVREVDNHVDRDMRFVIECLTTWRRSVLLSGAAGSGKTHLLQRLINYFKNETSLKVQVVASYASVAQRIDGRTICSVLGEGLADKPAKDLFRSIKYKYKRKWNMNTLPMLQQTDILIIDEISTFEPSFFEKLDELFRMARGNPEPFGGCRLLMNGDFCQLNYIPSKKPSELKLDDDMDEKKVALRQVVENMGNMTSTEREEDRYLFYNNVWKKLKLFRVFLNRQYRQCDDARFADLLNRLRFGELNDEDRKMLLARESHVSTSIQEQKIQPGQLVPFYIYPRRYPMITKNQERMNELVNVLREEKLEGPQASIVRLRAYYHVEKRLDFTKKISARQSTKNKQFANLHLPHMPKFGNLKGYVKEMQYLHICKHAQVMLRCNDYFEKGLYNGSIGVVTDITGLESGKIADVIVSVKFVKEDETDGYGGPVFRDPIQITKKSFKHAATDSHELVCDQIPLTLAYATTIHKIQGDTAHELWADVGGCFSDGQLYVALSRVSSLDKLHLQNFDVNSILCNSVSVEYERLENKYHTSDSSSVCS